VAVCGLDRSRDRTAAQMMARHMASAALWRHTLLLAAFLAVAPVAQEWGGAQIEITFGFAQALAKDDGSDGGQSKSDSGGSGSDKSGSSSSGSGSGSDSGSSSGSGSEGGGETSEGKSDDDGGGSEHSSETAKAAKADREDATVEVRGERIIIRYTDGFREEIARGILTLKDPKGRTVIKRPTTAADKARLTALAN
jgi:hypothetical protein